MPNQNSTSESRGIGPWYMDQNVTGKPSQWQPIETAPKDGSCVMVCGRHGISLAYYEAIEINPDYAWKDYSTCFSMDENLPTPLDAATRSTD